jgi:hypothetical protein
MNKHVTFNNLGTAISDMLVEYSDEVKEALIETQEELAVQGRAMIRAKSPKKTGEYAKSWGITHRGLNPVIRNAKHWRRTHLLEYGHTTPKGTRVSGTAHIEPTQKALIAEAEPLFRRNLK